MHQHIARSRSSKKKPATDNISTTRVVNSETDSILELQRTIGNQATIELLRKKQDNAHTTDNIQRKEKVQQKDKKQEGVVQRAVDEEGVPTDLDPGKDAQTISGLKAQYIKFQGNLEHFWDTYGLAHPDNKKELFQQLWGHYLEGLKEGAAFQDALASVDEVNADPGRTEKMQAPGFKSVLGVKSTAHPAAKPRTAEEQALADEMGVMRMNLAEKAINALDNLVDGFSAQFDRAIEKVKENVKAENKAQFGWFDFWSEKKKPNYIFWSGGKAHDFVKANHSAKDSIMLEMTMGDMAYLDGLGYDFQNNKAPKAITAYTGQNFQIWTALSQRYALKAAAEAQKGEQWNFYGYMSDVAVDDQSVYNTIERPTLLKELGADLDLTWRLVDEVNGKNQIVMESKDRNEIIQEMKQREQAKKATTTT